jgi:hypothetical protein
MCLVFYHSQVLRARPSWENKTNVFIRFFRVTRHSDPTGTSKSRKTWGLVLVKITPKNAIDAFRRIVEKKNMSADRLPDIAHYRIDGASLNTGRFPNQEFTYQPTCMRTNATSFIFLSLETICCCERSEKNKSLESLVNNNHQDYKFLFF